MTQSWICSFFVLTAAEWSQARNAMKHVATKDLVPVTIPFPQQTPHTVARMLRGHRMGVLKDGWLLLYEDKQSVPSADLVDRLCIVMTSDKRCLARIVRLGRRPGRWDLLTATGEQELDVALIWAELVTLIVPFTPTPEVASTLSGAS